MSKHKNGYCLVEQNRKKGNLSTSTCQFNNWLSLYLKFTKLNIVKSIQHRNYPQLKLFTKFKFSETKTESLVF